MKSLVEIIIQLLCNGRGFSPDVGTLDCTTKIIFSKFNVISKVRHMKDINLKFIYTT